jgi:transposase InsO family protein
LFKGFHQVPVKPGQEHLLAFVTPHGLFEYVRMPMGVTNGPAHFQNAMSESIKGLPSQNITAFMDDVGLHCEDVDSFFKVLEEFFEVCRRDNWKLNKDKCQFLLKSMEYVGYLCDGSGFTLTDSRRRALSQVATPTDTATLRSFLGLANYFRPFIANYAMMVKPLTAITGKGATFAWTPEREAAFQAVKEAAAGCAVLSFVDSEAELIVRTDASTVGAGAVLVQVKDGRESAVAFMSKAFDKTQVNWSTIEQEAFAVFYAIKGWSHFLLGVPFTVETDHRNLLYMARSTTPKVVRWHLALQEYDFVVRHIPGAENHVADALSRLHDVSYRRLQASPAQEDVERVELIRSVHNATVGHHGIDRTLELLEDKGYKTSSVLRVAVRDFVEACAVCQKTRLRQIPVAAALHTTAVQQPFETLFIDAVGPLPRDAAGNSSVLVLIDAFTRFVELVPCPDASALSAAKAILSVVGRWGVPRVLCSDQGSQFTAEVIAQLCKFLEIEQSFSIPYRPQSQGKVERVNQEVMRFLRVLILQHKASDEWSTFLPLVMRTVNASKSRITGLAPAQLMYGGAVDLSRQLLRLPEERADRVTYADYIEGVIRAQHRYAALARREQERHVEAYLASSPDTPTSFKVHDYVLVSYPERPPTKLHPKWKGPMIITEVNGDIYTCAEVLSNATMQVHVERLKLYRHDAAVSAEEAATWDSQSFLVEKILAHRGSTRKKTAMSFKVRWEGFGPEDDTWEPYSAVKDLEVFQLYKKSENLKI